MNVFLLYEDKDWGSAPKYSDANNIIHDLGLKTIFSVSAKEVLREDDKVTGVSQEDLFLSQTMKTVMMTPLISEKEIMYRQKMLRDAIRKKKLIGELYSLVEEMLRTWDVLGRKENRKGVTKSSASRLISDIYVLKLFVETLSTLKKRLGEEILQFDAAGFHAFYERLCETFTDEKEEALNKIIEDISFYTGDAKKEEDIPAWRAKATLKPKFVLGFQIAGGLKCDQFVVEEVSTKNQKFKSRNSFGERFQEFWNMKKPGAFDVRNMPEIGEQVDALEYEVVRFVVSYCSSFIYEFSHFFDELRFELGFYKAAILLEQHINRFGLPYYFPTVGDRGALRFKNLKEFVMAMEQRIVPVGNTCDISDKMLLVITGANQGGKSTFLRSIGIAQIMMQCGLPVIADQYESGIFPSFFTHFTRREDSAMNSGRLDEELNRMSQIVDHLGESSMVLLNESFATTTEKEGSVIAYDIAKALTEAGVKVLTVTHLLSFAQRIYKEREENQDTGIEFFSAERTEDGKRTYRMIQHEPELTSFGIDLYNSIIEEA
ncbi:MAG: hypothetical protein IKB01_06555 [Lachnospiraceae bacterium]|nr:hypothetical protein [Lachnospiraceae bacterium]MBR3684132.1 hypothetical protein [Lachnospiraceae bacterium]